MKTVYVSTGIAKTDFCIRAEAAKGEESRFPTRAYVGFSRRKAMRKYAREFDINPAKCRIVESR